MYSFSHRLWVGPEQHDDDEKLLQAPSLWVNHYPARSTRFETARAAFVETGVDMNVIMRSGYQGRRWLSRFKVRVDHGGLVIELR